MRSAVAPTAREESCGHSRQLLAPAARASEPAGPALGTEVSVVADDAGGVAVERATRARLGAPRARDGHGGWRADAGVAGCGAVARDKRDCGWHTVGPPAVHGNPLLGVAARALLLRRQWLHLDANLARYAGTEPRVLVLHT
eukprot:scaffold37722_cov75-Phaeocystis_antarctica.AAC.3